jgi:transcriptional regulator with XRE-family HTH domain
VEDLMTEYQIETATSDAVRLRAARERLGLSRAQAAKMTGVPARTWENIEQGRAGSSTLTAPLLKLLAYVERFGPLDEG